MHILSSLEKQISDLDRASALSKGLQNSPDVVDLEQIAEVKAYYALGGPTFFNICVKAFVCVESINLTFHIIYKKCTDEATLEVLNECCGLLEDSFEELVDIVYNNLKTHGLADSVYKEECTKSRVAALVTELFYSNFIFNYIWYVMCMVANNNVPTTVEEIKERMQHLSY